MVHQLNHFLNTSLRRWLPKRRSLDESKGPSHQKPAMDPSQLPRTTRPGPAIELDDQSGPSSFSFENTTASLDQEEEFIAPDEICPATSVPNGQAEMSQTIVQWPTGQIPVEIFELIASTLPRSDVKTLRLVCSEFESKVSAKYFKNVVVPFRSELYGSLPRDEFGARKHPSSALLSSGMRIFESFGPHILRFALSLEINEDALAHPPIKPTQAAVPSFWGVYRWPHTSYNRYSDLESIEQTADEMEGMKEALRHLTKVSNLGLCCDAGLGFLVHPDHVARTSKVEQPVFAMQNWRREQRASRILNDDDDVVNITDFNGLEAPRRKSSGGDPMEFKRTILHKMVLDAGFSLSEMEEVIDMLLNSEGTDLATINFDERSMSFSRTELGRDNVLAPQQEADGAVVWRGFGSLEPEAERSDLRRWPLAPASLTRSQKELLLELEWAHRAMIQSYVIAMIDNAGMGAFNCLTTLTIAKIPSSHVHILCRDDFWTSFSSLTNVSLGVIPDWRRITKPAPGCVEDEPISPIEAVPKTYQLLQRYIGRQPSIESLHFEWICGGEFAPSSYQRNQYILPAPFLANPRNMVAGNLWARNDVRLLNLPHIKHLSLKNCWFSPHVLFESVRQMALCSLEKLELETVSLCGQPTQVMQFPIVHQHMALQVQQGFNAIPNVNFNNLVMQNGFLGAAQPAQFGALGVANNPLEVPDLPAPDANEPLPQPVETASHLVMPEWMTWAGFLEHFSPSDNVRQALEQQNAQFTGDTPRDVWARKLQNISEYFPRANRMIADENRYKLKCLSFKSCGYVHVEAHFINTRALLPPGAQGILPPMNHLSLPSRLMQKSKDKLLGQIVPYMRTQEMFNLTTAFHMEPGWGDSYDDKVTEDAIADGIDLPGLGRFTGLMEGNITSSWSDCASDSMSASDGSG